MKTRINLHILPVVILVFIFCSWSTVSNAQTPGDEDREMLNKGKARDQKAVDEAVKTWWTASMKNHDKRLQWWREAKFGMFIHWGVYSEAGGEWEGKKISGYAEHLMRKEKISRDEYLELAHRFNPVKFNAEEWVKNAKAAGMKYMIITAKHHDGFAMYPSTVSEFNIKTSTPFPRDPMAELSAACKKYGLKFGFYYSHAFDWEHPDAPGNDWEFKNPGGDLNLYGGRDWYDLHPDLLIKAQRYVNEKAIPQISELIEKYHPDILWFDTPQKLPLSENIRILKAIRELDDQVVVNGRLVRFASSNFGDYKNTADRPAEFYPVTGDWEAIPTTNESYGYSKFDSSHKPVSHFIRLIASAASRGGNLLMNIGPKGDGSFDIKDVNILKGIGRWMDRNAESIYGTSAGPLPLQDWGVSTIKNDKLYLHVFKYPADRKLYVGGWSGKYSAINLLNDPSKSLTASRLNQHDLLIELPGKAPDSVNTVIVIRLNGKQDFDSIRFIAPNMEIARLLAFDADQQGQGFNFGDGKTDRYFVEGWKSSAQSISWKFRMLKPAEFKVVIKYIAGENSGGSWQLESDTIPGEIHDIVPGKNNLVTTKAIGTISFKQGVHELKIKALRIDGQELMKVLELQLIPSDK